MSANGPESQGTPKPISPVVRRHGCSWVGLPHPYPQLAHNSSFSRRIAIGTLGVGAGLATALG